MLNSQNTFKEAVKQLDQGGPTITVDEQGKLSSEQKQQLFKQTKMYIQLEEIIADLSQDLCDNETLVGYLPFTNEGNSAAATSGIMGMNYVTNAKAQKYRDNFHDLRGNRLLIFTNQRMIFTILIEFLEERRYYAYPYEKINGIRLEKHPVGYFEWGNGRFLPQRKKTYWYTLDFQSASNIFTEVLQPADVRKFQEMAASIPALQAIAMDEHSHRDTPFDYLFSNTKISFRAATVFFLVIFLFILGMLLFQFATGRGTFGQWLTETTRLNPPFIFSLLLNLFP